jgi:trimethylamine--corrinoid protein Co-methyltransferase
MRVNYRVNASTQFEVLSQDQCEEIYRASLKLLQYTGLVIHNDAALALLQQHGAQVSGNRAYIPAFMVERARGTAPASFTIYSREGDRAKNIEVGPNYIHYGPSATATHTIDPKTGERRKYVREDAADTARVCDALPNIDYTASMGTISDVRPELADIYEFAIMMANSGKPIFGWSYTLDGCRDIHEMAVAVAGGEDEFIRRPNYFFFGESMPPLGCDDHAAEKIMYCARHGIPLIFTPVQMSGASTPATLSGTVLLSVADSLLGLVLSQILRPGTPFVMGGTATVLDMKTGLVSYGAPELSLMCAATAEVARFMGVPHWSTSGASDSKLDDNQAALEGAISNLFAGLCGSDLIHNVGFIEACMTGSLRYLIMMDESIGYVKRVLRGIDVNEDTLAVDVIDKVGPGGHFLNEDHTLRHFKTETWYPTLMDRRHYQDWVRLGSKSMGDRAQEKLNTILDTHRVKPLRPDIQTKIDAILATAEQRFAGK